MLRARPRLALALSLLALMPSLALAASNDLEAEINEEGRNDLNAAGQANCVVEARGGGTPSCPLEPTGRSYPPSHGVLIVDGYHSLPVFIDPAATVEPGATPTATAAQGGNTARGTDRALPDVLTPGPSKFLAWFGRWHDADNDGVIDLRYTGTIGAPGNEFAPVFLYGGTLHSFVEPGNHPPPTGGKTPSASDPDFSYVYQNSWVWVSEGSTTTFGASFFVDGSVLGTYRVTTVNDVVFTPSERFVFTPGPTSRIDIDRYPAMAPGPIADLYAAVGTPIVQSLGDRGPTPCPPSCSTGPQAIGATPLAPHVGPYLAPVFARSLQESSPGSMNTAEGRLAEFSEEHRAWIDVLPRVRPFSVMAGTSSSGEAAMPPGELHLDVRLGVWRDVNGDGYVGVASTPDAYEYGARPVPDRYEDPRGEFIGMWNTSLAAFPTTFWVTLIPDTTWGPRGAFTRNDAAACEAAPEACAPAKPGGAACEAHRPVASCFNPPRRAVAFGSESLRVELGRATERGHFVGGVVSIPDGSTEGGFTICTDFVIVTRVSAGVEVEETVRDCDHVGRFEVPG